MRYRAAGNTDWRDLTAVAYAPRTFKEARAAAFELAGRGYTIQTIAYSLSVSVEAARELLFGRRA